MKFNYSSLSQSFFESSNFSQAKKFAELALNLDSSDTTALLILGLLCQHDKQHEKAISFFQKILSIKKDHPGALYGIGFSQQSLGLFEFARRDFEKLLKVDPLSVWGWMNLSLCEANLAELSSALVSINRAIQIRSDVPEFFFNKGKILSQLGMHLAASEAYMQANLLRPNHPQTLFNLANALGELLRHGEAAELYKRVMQLDPSFPYARGNFLHQAMLMCDWNNFSENVKQLENEIIAGHKVALPFIYQAVGHDEALLRKCAEVYVRDEFPCRERLSKKFNRHRKIKIGYVCGEFREHATSLLMAGVFENHNKTAFEVYGFDNGYSDESVTRQRLENSFDQLININKLSDRAAALLVSELEIDILVNLNGHYGQSRMGLFAHKPAPIQVNYLGFPGTLGASYIDYLISDDICIPNTSRAHYIEEVVYLPGCYQPNESIHQFQGTNNTRAELGLSEDQFVYCCFNNSYKITPKIFDVWLQILKETPKSVLVLLKSNDWMEYNLRNEASKAGLNSDRLIFVPRISPIHHLNRHAMIDLFLDTHPYNAHTTASDALRTNTLVLTFKGTTFPSRVSESLLLKAGLSGLIAKTPEEYLQIAVNLYRDRAKHRALKNQLSASLSSGRFTNIEEFTKNLERLFVQFVERAQSTR